MITRYKLSKRTHVKGLTTLLNEEELPEQFSATAVVKYLRDNGIAVTKEEVKDIRSMKEWNEDEVLDIPIDCEHDIRIECCLEHNKYKEYEMKVGYFSKVGISLHGEPYIEHSMESRYDLLNKEEVERLRDYCNKILNDWDVLHR